MRLISCVLPVIMFLALDVLSAQEPPKPKPKRDLRRQFDRLQIAGLYLNSTGPGPELQTPKLRMIQSLDALYAKRLKAIKSETEELLTGEQLAKKQLAEEDNRIQKISGTKADEAIRNAVGGTEEQQLKLADLQRQQATAERNLIRLLLRVAPEHIKRQAIPGWLRRSVTREYVKDLELTPFQQQAVHSIDDNFRRALEQIEQARRVVLTDRTPHDKSLTWQERQALKDLDDFTKVCRHNALTRLAAVLTDEQWRQVGYEPEAGPHIFAGGIVYYLPNMNGVKLESWQAEPIGKIAQWYGAVTAERARQRTQFQNWQNQLAAEPQAKPETDLLDIQALGRIVGRAQARLNFELSETLTDEQKTDFPEAEKNIELPGGNDAIDSPATELVADLELRSSMLLLVSELDEGYHHVTRELNRQRAAITRQMEQVSSGETKPPPKEGDAEKTEAAGPDGQTLQQWAQEIDLFQKNARSGVLLRLAELLGDEQAAKIPALKEFIKTPEPEKAPAVADKQTSTSAEEAEKQ